MSEKLPVCAQIAAIWTKNGKIFWLKYFQNHNIGPWKLSASINL
jgi:hypothetical protein